MVIGLSQRDIEEILENGGLKKGEAVDADKLKKGIAKAIIKNNEELASNVKSLLKMIKIKEN